MKKSGSFLLAIALCLSMLLSLSACSFFKHPIEKFADELEEKGNAQMVMTMYDVPYLGTISIKMQIDGDIMYMPASMINEETYYEKVGDQEYEYTKDLNGVWTKTLSEDGSSSSDPTEDEEWDELLNPDNYERDYEFGSKKKVYELKDGVSFENFDDVEIIIEDDTFTIEMEMNMDGMWIDVKMEFSKIGEINLTLPTVN